MTSKITDFLGTEIKVDDYLAFPGKGNVAAEYGLLLLKVTMIEQGKIYGLRFDMLYNVGGTTNHVNYLKKTYIGNHNKTVIVKPPQIITDAFDRLLNADGMKESHKIQPELSSWVHGSDKFSWK